MERDRDQERGESTESILTQEFGAAILHDAKSNLQRDGSLRPVLFLNLARGEAALIPLMLPETHAEKVGYFTAIGLMVRQTGKIIKEALFVSEVWYVAQGSPRPRVAPSQHPDRKEAIVVVGRNDAGTQQTHIIQPFGRNSTNEPVFEPLAIAEYNTPIGKGDRAIGLIDYLFPQPPTSHQLRHGILN